MDRHEIQRTIEDLHRRYLSLTDGAVATYIPELGKANPDDFGISIATTDGRVFETGDCDRTFTIQSISKPFIFGIALEEFGERELTSRVGVEPSGDAFNAIELEKGTNRPYNPMVNSGAIATTALLHARHRAQTFDRVLERLSAAAGRRLAVDEHVYDSERRTGHRNRAIAHLLRNFALVHDEPEDALDVYFRQCAVLVSAHDLAIMSATLANMGCNPVTGVQVFDVGTVKYVLAIMFTCGMYDYSGEWAYRVGLPAKSGFSGGVMAVVNRQVGVAAYSPRLDARGNSVRGIEVCIGLADQFGLHAFDCMNVGSRYLQAML
jgi:glutaminase